MTIKSKSLVALLLFFSTALPAELCAQPINNLVIVNDALSPSTEIKLNGYLAKQLDGSLNNRILAQDVDRLIEPFKPQNQTETHQWQSEFWGKWTTSAVLAYQYHPDERLKKAIDNAVAGLLATQRADGYIGNYANDHHLQGWDIWGRKYCMLGLLAYFDLTKNKKSLTGAARIADNLMDELRKSDGLIINKGNMKGMAASSVLEPVCLLYRFTGNPKYLDFAKEIVRQWETPKGPQLISKSVINVAERFPGPKEWYGPEQGQKAYEMMSCYEGLLELYRITGNETYKIAVENAWQNIRDTEINIVGSGASTETWFGGKARQNMPVHHYQETCVTVTWLKLTNQLLRLTGDSRYADEAEKTYYNALLGATSYQGGAWAKYTPLNGQRLPGSEQCGMGLNCCVANGPRGLFNLPFYLVMGAKDGIQVNFFADGSYKMQSPGGQKLLLTQHTQYPQNGNVEMDLAIEKPEEMVVSIRIPNWSKRTKLMVNGEAVDNLQPGSIAQIKRNWKNGDKIFLELDFRGRLERMDNGIHSIAVLRGPIVLARDSRYENAGLEAVLKPVTDNPGYIALTEIAGDTRGAYIAVKAEFMPEFYTETQASTKSIILCDYASAGNSPEQSFYKVWSSVIVDPRE